MNLQVPETLKSLFCNQIHISTFFFSVESSEIAEVLGKLKNQPNNNTEALSSKLSLDFSNESQKS